MLKLIEKGVVRFCSEMGNIFILLLKSVFWIFRPPLQLRLIANQMEEFGIRSLPVVLITGGFTGMVFALQSYQGFQRFGAETLIGPVVSLSICRELAPVLTALMVAGRAGSAMAAEIGTMKVTEQIDALETLATNPVKYLVVPRIISGIIILPVLTIFADSIGMFGGYVVSVNLLGTNPTIYVKSSFDILQLGDVTNGLIKAAFFGLGITLVGCYYGFTTEGGAKGVGRATTKAVVVACMSILILDFFLTKVLWGI